MTEGGFVARYRLIATGGTIASRRTAGGLVADVSGKELLLTSGLDAEAGIDVEDLDTKGSFAFTLDDVAELTSRVRSALDDGVDGVVVTHGTDTLEESAFLVDLVHDDDRPVVFTGAQRPFDDPASDGPGNLSAAFRIAASPVARGLGPLVVFDGMAWQARGVRKVDTVRSAAFAAPGRGPSLRITPSGIVALSRSRRAPVFAAGLEEGLPRVDVVACYVGSDDLLLQAAVSAGARGVVLQAMGLGNTTPAVVHAVTELSARGIPVVVTSRVVSGPVVPLYSGGGGADLAAAGAIFADDLSPWQARILVSMAIAAHPEEPVAALRAWLDF